MIHVDLGYIFSTFWPVFIIWFGQSLIYARGGALWGSVVPIIIGSYFLGRNLDLIDFSFGDLIKYAIPIMLIGFGLQVIFKPKPHTPPPSPPSPDDFSSHRSDDYDIPDPPEARPLDSSWMKNSNGDLASQTRLTSLRISCPITNQDHRIFMSRARVTAGRDSGRSARARSIRIAASSEFMWILTITAKATATDRIIRMNSTNINTTIINLGTAMMR